jgi:hypothetical protein
MLATLSALIRNTRQHHAIEHAALHLLSTRVSGRRMAGVSDPFGFTIVGAPDAEIVRRAVSDAMLRLQAGDRHLAIHPNCGTNLATTALLVTVAALVGGQRSAQPARSFSARTATGVARARSLASAGHAPATLHDTGRYHRPLAGGCAQRADWQLVDLPGDHAIARGVRDSVPHSIIQQ